MGLFDFLKKKKTDTLPAQKQGNSEEYGCIMLDEEEAKKELQQSKLLFIYENDYIDDKDFSHYSKAEYYLTSKKKIIYKSKSVKADIHSLSNNSCSEFYYYLPFEFLNNHIRNYNLPEANNYLGITEENCEKYL